MSGPAALALGVAVAETVSFAGVVWVAVGMARRRPVELAAFALAVAGYFLALEQTGVDSGRFRYAPAFHQWLGTVPVFVPLTWILFLRGAMRLSDRLLGARVAHHRAAPLLLALGDGVCIAVAFLPCNLLARWLALWQFDVRRGLAFALGRDFVGALIAVALFGGVYRVLQKRAAGPRLLLTALALTAIVVARRLVAR